MKFKEYKTNNGGSIFADELLPCPFCGSDVELNFIGNDFTKSRKVEVKCPKCRVKRIDAGIRLTHEQVLLNAIDQWNERL